MGGIPEFSNSVVLSKNGFEDDCDCYQWLDHVCSDIKASDSHDDVDDLVDRLLVIKNVSSHKGSIEDGRSTQTLQKPKKRKKAANGGRKKLPIVKSVFAVLSVFFILAVLPVILQPLYGGISQDIFISVNPENIRNNDTLFVNVTIPNKYNITSVSADLAGIETINLSLIDNSTAENFWQAVWMAHDVVPGGYIVMISALDEENTSYSAGFQWNIVYDEDVPEGNLSDIEEHPTENESVGEPSINQTENQTIGPEIEFPLQNETTEGVKKPAKLVEVDPLIEKTLKQDGKVRVIIRFEEQQKNFSECIASLEQVGFKKTAEAQSTSFVAGVVDQFTLEEIQKNQNITGVYLDKQYMVFLEKSLPLIQLPQTIQEFQVTGKGIKICMLDTGVDPALVNYSYGYDFVNDDSDPSDDNGHGTAVAAVIKNIAPEAELVVVKVIGAEGTGYESDVLEGLEYCIDQHPDIICFSIGSRQDCAGFCDVQFVTSRCNYAVANGIFIVASAGNDGGDSLAVPACGSQVFSVGATDDNDQIAWFSNVNPTLDLFAPGVDITTVAGMSSGTSMSVPHVVGAAALVLEHERLPPLDLSYRLR
ncbi:MAG: S8 family serine peptidase, partial [Euryarchaeota archaeon]|nr:S8 family serine peptidase [Euryarchaeota archaeon]